MSRSEAAVLAAELLMPQVEADARPFIRWAGGKTQLLPELLARVPAKFGRYFEPFLGGGALYFELVSGGHLRPSQAWLSDVNFDLINAYRHVAVEVDEVIKHLLVHIEKHSKEHYLRVRDDDLSFAFAAAAARFIYLNKTGFNGLYRVNKAGKFNVPWGKRAKFDPDAFNLRACARALRGAAIATGSYDEVTQPEPGDFVYFDPPYVPVSATSNFTEYTADGFSRNDQVALAHHALKLKGQGVNVLLSNSIAAKPLYEAVSGSFGCPEFKIEVIQARRNINSKGSGRGAVEEILVS